MASCMTSCMTIYLGEPIILTDILGSEDALGTMDFKVARIIQCIT